MAPGAFPPELAAARIKGKQKRALEASPIQGRGSGLSGALTRRFGNGIAEARGGDGEGGDMKAAACLPA